MDWTFAVLWSMGMLWGATEFSLICITLNAVKYILGPDLQKILGKILSLA